MIVVGIDPGLSGGIAAVRSGQLLHVQDMPTESIGGTAKVKNRVDAAMLAADIRMLRSTHGDDLMAVVERVNSMPGQGVASMMSLGDSVGAIRGVLQTLGVAIEWVTPREWKASYRLDADKDLARAKASALWPLSAQQWARKKDDGRAEAALIAMYGWRTFA